MPTGLNLSAEEIAALTAQVPPAVAALLLALLDRLAQQEQLLADQTQTITALTARVAELQAQVERTSHNSHQPPASDGFKKQPRSLRRRSGKPPGGQAGHPGHTLTLRDDPDAVVLHRPSQCAGCGATLTDIPASARTRRQVVDLPPLRLVTTEHQAESVGCPACGHLTVAAFPPDARDPIQYGPHLAALVVLLRVYQLLPSARTAELRTDLLGSAPSEGTLDTMLHTAATTLEPVVEQIGAGVRAAAVAHFDETGCYVEDKRYWLHVAATPHLTYYRVHRARGHAGSTAAGVLPGFRGIAVHDSYAPYWQYECSHALCNAHILRELAGISERGGQAWATQMAELLRAMLATTEQAAATGVPAEEIAGYEVRYRALVVAGLAANPVVARGPEQKAGRVKQSVATNLLLRLRDHEAEVLRFLHERQVPFDNNQAERDIRMMKVQQKIAGRFRTQTGAATFCTIRSYISTLRKQGLHVFTALQQTFQGQPLIPATVG
jgi:transposase